jgi:predicted MFS family arabinose efflux permease
VPIAGAVALLAVLLIAPDQARERARSFDLPGALTATAGATLLVFALVQGPESGWGSPEIVSGFALAAVLLGTFVAIEARSRDPLMPLRMLANHSLRGAMAITFLFMGSFGAIFYVLTIYFQEVLGYDALQAGLAFLVPSVVIFVGTQLGERITTRSNVRATLLTGMAIGAAGTALLGVQLSADASYLGVAPGIVLYALGQGITWTGMWIAAAAGVAPREQGVASGMASTAMQVGAAVGLAVLVAVANSGLDGLTGEALRGGLADGLQTATFIAAGGILLGALVALTLRPRAAPAEAAEPIHAAA